jgi:hypothetical protein
VKRRFKPFFSNFETAKKLPGRKRPGFLRAAAGKAATEKAIVPGGVYQKPCLRVG